MRTTIGRRIRVSVIGAFGLAMAVALVPPVVVTMTATPASADTVIFGCTIVSNPTSTHFTNCPNSNLTGASLSGLDLSYANFAGATFVTCTNGPLPPANCVVTDLTNANLTQANLSGAVLSANTTAGPIGIYGLASGFANLSGADLTGADLSTGNGRANFTGANLAGANLADGNFGGANFTDANLTGAALTGAVMASDVEPFGVMVYATLTGATLTGTILVPANQSVTATGPSGAVVTWSTPASIPGATPGPCQPPSGSSFPVGSSEVSCAVIDQNGNQASGTFPVVVNPEVLLTITTTSLPSATIGSAYSAALTASNGNPPYRWKLVPGSGRLPRGLKLNKAMGVI
jgi:uncharacterized protein YjbI with pentapeptide repeats